MIKSVRMWCWVLAGATVLGTFVAASTRMMADDKGKKGKKDCWITPEDAQMVGINGWREFPVFTVGETLGGYTPLGLPDGMGAFKWNEDTVRVLVNHEAGPTVGYPYTLANGAVLTGARVSYFDIDRKTLGVCETGLAYDTMYNRAGRVVTGPGDLEFGGLNRLCSSHSYDKGTFGFKNDLYFTGEETGGGTEWVLDVQRGELWAAPAMGRAAWENVTALESGDKDTVAILIGDDRAGAPLLLYLGQKQPGNNFLARNGLAKGKLLVWVANDLGVNSPEDFNGTGNCQSGTFVEIDYYRPDLAGNGDYDELGYATQAHQDWLAAEAGAFEFSRPEDLATSPFDGKLAVLASTGNGAYPSDVWGTTYLINVDFSDLSGEICIIYDGDDAGGGTFADPDYGIRSPDNLEWSEDGYIYINEDKSIGAFGLTSGAEASMWKLSPFFPVTGDIERIAVMNRAAGLPGGQTDPVPNDIGNWESSGVIDVSRLFGVKRYTLLLANVQAHSVRDGSIGGNAGLVQGGQLFFLSNAQE